MVTSPYAVVNIRYHYASREQDINERGGVEGCRQISARNGALVTLRDAESTVCSTVIAT